MYAVVRTGGKQIRVVPGDVVRVERLAGDPGDKVWNEAYTTDDFYHTTSRWAQRRTKGKSRASDFTSANFILPPAGGPSQACGQT